MPQQGHVDHSRKAIEAIFAMASRQRQQIIEPVASGAIRNHYRDICLGIFENYSAPEPDIPAWEFSEIAHGSF